MLRILLLTGTFFCVTITAQSFPRTATDVRPPWFMALNAYSKWYIKHSQEIWQRCYVEYTEVPKCKLWLLIFSSTFSVTQLEIIAGIHSCVFSYFKLKSIWHNQIPIVLHLSHSTVMCFCPYYRILELTLQCWSVLLLIIRFTLSLHFSFAKAFGSLLLFFKLKPVPVPVPCPNYRKCEINRVIWCKRNQERWNFNSW